MIAIIGHTATELIYERVDSNQEHRGLTNWKHSPNSKIMKYNISIAKNYLNDKEIKKFESLSTLFLNYAEDMANEHNLMTIQKWMDATDDWLKFQKKKILSNSSNISHKKALANANEEYEKFWIKQDKKTYIINGWIIWEIFKRK